MVKTVARSSDDQWVRTGRWLVKSKTGFKSYDRIFSGKEYAFFICVKKEMGIKWT
jgi:hypothetical protein